MALLSPVGTKAKEIKMEWKGAGETERNSGKERGRERERERERIKRGRIPKREI